MVLIHMLTELTESTVITYLRNRGVVDANAPARAYRLGGGVSNDVLRVDTDDRSYVIKQALGKLRVAEEWTANRERTLTEAEALRLVDSLTPHVVPEVIDVDADSVVLTIEAAPIDWRDWRSVLLGHPTTDDQASVVARTLGSVLATWHSATARGSLVGTRFDDPETFEQLRVRPYHRAVMERRPDVRDEVGAVVELMFRHRDYLVHGDFSPKNIMVSGERAWVIDFEVAHLGDPLFDIAFLLCHLLLKSVHHPQRAKAHAAAAAAFLCAYRDAVQALTDTSLTPIRSANIVDAELSAHMGCLLLARVHGKSPAEYLSKDSQRVVAGLGVDLLRSTLPSPLDAWDVVCHGEIAAT